LELRLDYFVAAVEAVSLTVAAPRKLPTPQPSFRRSAHALVPMVTDHRGEHGMAKAKTKTKLQPSIDRVVGLGGQIGFSKTRSALNSLRMAFAASTGTGETLGKTWLRWRAHRFEPPADVHLGMSFAAIMPGTGRACAFRIPTVHGKSRVSTSNHEPVGGIRSHDSTDLTPEFLQRCHG